MGNSRTSTKGRFLGFIALPMALVASYLFVSPAAHAQAASTTWKTFHDPLYGFTLSYPTTWILVPERDGSHITLLNPATGTTLSPIVTTQAGTPADALKQATPPARAIKVQTRMVAGHPAMDSVLPFMPGPLTDGRDGARAAVQSRSVVLPVQNQSGTTNVYTFMLTQPTDLTGKVSAAVDADNTIFETILNTFTLPSTVASVVPSSYYPCDDVCWADNNYRYTYYDDSSGSYAIYCDYKGYNNPYSTNPQCADGNLYGAQVPISNDAYFQPNFECADFVSRALTQTGQIPGLNNGGVKGSAPATSPTPANVSGYYNYGNYPLTYTPYSGDYTYDLIDVGIPGIPGLYDYLINSGLGTNIHQNISEASPGDVIFFYDGSISPGNRAHTVIITSSPFQSQGKWDVFIDSHNVAAYHDDFQADWYPVYGDNFEIIHLNSTHGSSGQASLYTEQGSGASWTSFTDQYGQSASYVETADDSKGNATAWAQFSDYLETVDCAVAVYVPSGDATANLTFGVKMSNNSWAYRTVNENNIDGWALLFKWGELSSAPELINVGNNNGEYGNNSQLMGVGEMAFIC